ncbi:MAG: DUF2303 family protein [Mizugakiibacter sp.]|uniref:DUF2303 family protein n=1 Tax=Mizugakiibacter sp. TaxID=1972610 RepID=UPI003210EAC2
MENLKQDVQAALDAGAALGEIRVPQQNEEGTVPFVVVPAGYAVKDIEKLLLHPTRKRGNVTLLDASSFIDYTKKHAITDTSAIYADVDYEAGRYGLVAVLNDHGTEHDYAMWGDFRASLTPMLSLEWKRWKGNNHKAMPQADFAAFIEDNLGDIATVDGMPTGSDMLNMALAFQMNSDKRFKKVIDLQGGGTNLEFVDQADEETTSKMQFFKRFTIGIPVFQGATDGYPIEARLKFRMNGGALSFWYELVRPDRVFKTAVSSEIAKIKEETGLMVLFGVPSSAKE